MIIRQTKTRYISLPSLPIPFSATRASLPHHFFPFTLGGGEGQGIPILPPLIANLSTGPLFLKRRGIVSLSPDESPGIYPISFASSTGVRGGGKGERKREAEGLEISIFHIQDSSSRSSRSPPPHAGLFYFIIEHRNREPILSALAPSQIYLASL